LKAVLLRLYRAAVLVCIAWLIHAQHRWMKAQTEGALNIAQVRDFFPEAATLGARDPASGAQAVLDANEDRLGLVAQTAPLSDTIIGYSGPTNTLIACDAQGRVIGLRVLHSDDTVEHLQEVLRHRGFFDAFLGLKIGDAGAHPKVDAVSGATLTSTAIAEGVLRRLGQEGPPLRFPQEITVAEVRELLPQAVAIRPSKRGLGLLDVLDATPKVIALACRTSPASDAVVGYKGPTDSLLILDPQGAKVIAFRVRKSYDTKDYVGYVTGDKFFTHLFDGMGVEKLAGLDFKEAKVEGVSGATETSWAVAEGLKRRAKTLLDTADAGPAWTRIRWDADNIGLCLMIAWSCVVAFSPLRGRTAVRVLHQMLLVGYVGFFAAGMLSQALLAGWAGHGVPWTGAPALVLLTAAAFLLPLLTRHQFYCHHFCPHGALQQLVAHRLKWQIRVPRGVSQWLEKLPVLLLALVLLTAMLGWRVNLNALEPFDAYLFRIAGWGTITVAVAGLIASLFVPMAYCRYGCPTGALLKFARYAGAADRFGKRDALAAIFVLIAAVIHWKREALMAWIG
jgi:NosR/NirI family transcriptional regulator, nitrous oxide reductase regulator